jgi:hypothetical protein
MKLWWCWDTIARLYNLSAQWIDLQYDSKDLHGNDCAITSLRDEQAKTGNQSDGTMIKATQSEYIQ